ncbi:hypothetical protein [Niastella sp. OAS944]|uniref:hypothetical protein n=1 Tax=Niastella sp. OAS944 TaxID=2664089 RepID=UPI0034964FDF|nr:outer membrane protein OmpA-like peptidoglycan-associated protein [Chitinophagaceae bacterium OAS944]
MIRTLLFVGLLSMSILIASCGPSHCVQPLTKTVIETLKYLKKEVSSTIKITAKKVQCNEVDVQIGNKIIDSLNETINQFDSLTAISVHLHKSGTKEEILTFAERTNVVIQKALTNIKTLCDLYDISTSSQFETAIFFPADSFNIPAEKTDDAKKVMEPVAQRIVRFFAEHPRQKFEAVIVCSGSLNDQQQNIKLSERRARAVANLLIKQIKLNEEFIPKPQLVNYHIQWVAQREEAPGRRKRKRHKIKDQRRNTVSLTWNLLPASIYTEQSTISTMSQINKRANIEEVYVHFFGKVLEPKMKLPTELPYNSKNKVPFEVEFNSSWKISHECKNCFRNVSFGEDYETHAAAYTKFNNMDSRNYKTEFLNNIVQLFKNLELRAVNSVYYINSLNFEYVSDLQRMTSLSPILYHCPHCKTEYLARFGIGVPQAPEKGNPMGYTGNIFVDEIIQIETANDKGFAGLLEENKI